MQRNLAASGVESNVTAVLLNFRGYDTYLEITVLLAALLGINPHTGLKGMNILVDEGIIYKRRGMGMYVQTGAGEKVRAKRRNAFDERFVQALVAEAKKLGLTKQQVVDLVEKGYDHA